MTNEWDDWLVVGRIRGAHGVRGELSVDPMTDFPDRFRLLERVYLGPKRAEYGLESARAGGRTFIKLAGVDSRDVARQFSGQDIWIPRNQAMKLPEGQLYADEIIGLRVETVSGDYLGLVTDLIATGANDVYVVKTSSREVLIPAICDVVKAIDVGRGLVVVEVIDGLLG